MKKALKWLVSSLLTLILLVLGLVGYLLGTESGTEFVLHEASAQMPGKLSLGKVKGKLLGRLELSAIEFDIPQAASGKLESLVLDWSPAALFNKRVHILELSASGADIQLAPSEAKPESNEKVQLPEISLPLEILLDRLALASIKLMPAPDARLVQINHAQLAARWDANGLHLSNLDIATPEASLVAKAKVKPTGNYPLEFSNRLELHQEGLPRINIEGNAQGDLGSLKLVQKLSGDLDIDLDMDLSSLLEAPAWNGHIAIKQLRPAVLSPDVPGILMGVIHSDGDLNLASVQADMQMRDEGRPEINWDAHVDLAADLVKLALDIRKLDLTQTDSGAKLALTGKAASDLSFDLKGDWDGLRWPLVGAAEYWSESGKVALQGSVDDYRLQLGAKAGGLQVPSGDWSLAAKGGRESAQIERLEGQTLEGIISLAGELKWLPEVQWNLALDGDGINPGAQYPEWPGKLGWRVKSQGALADGGVKAGLVLDELDGRLRDYPVQGKGRFELAPGQVVFQNFQLSSGDARINADGSLGESASIDWKLDVRDLGQLLPQASGSLIGGGKLAGNIQQPRLTFDLSAKALSAEGASLESLESSGDIDLSWKQTSRVTLSGVNLSQGGNLVSSMKLDASGDLAKHQLALSASHDLANLNLSLQGGLAGQDWAGLLSRLEIASKDMGDWKLDKPTNIKAGAQAASIGKTCLGRESSALCVQGDWSQAKGSSGNASLRDFPLDWLKPWFPDNLTDVDGELNLQAQGAFKDKPTASLTASIEPGELSLLMEGVARKLPHDGLSLTAKVEKDALSSDFKLGVDGNQISGAVQSPDLLKAADLMQARLAGSIHVDAGNFKLVEALVPDVRELDARVQADFNLDGKLGKPGLVGQGGLDVKHLLVPVAGLELSGTHLDLQANNQQASISGALVSPEGRIEIDGKAVLDAASGWPLDMSIKGDNFHAVNLPEIQAYISPNLLLKKSASGTSLKGEVIVPKADILLRDLPQGAQDVSPDVVIVQQQKAEPDTSSPLSMDVKLGLGKGVHFVGFGLNAFIDGQLTVRSQPGEQMLGSGEFRIEQGTYRAYGQDLVIEKGIILFPGGPLTKPGVNLRAYRQVGEVVAGINAIGAAEKPRITTFSNPPMAERDVISYILTGSPTSSAGQGAKLSVGRQINSKLSVEAGTDVKTGESEFKANYRINRAFSVQTTTGSASNAVDFFYTLELGGEKEPEPEAQETKP